MRNMSLSHGAGRAHGHRHLGAGVAFDLASIGMTERPDPSLAMANLPGGTPLSDTDRRLARRLQSAPR
jgi:hypothetical protein